MSELAGPELDLTWLGHATVRVELDGMTVLTDPVLGSTFGPVRRYAAAPRIESWSGVDLVVISHMHRDHLDLPSLRRLGRDVPLIVPEGAGRFLEAAGFHTVEELPVGRDLRVGALSITATPAAHGGFRPFTGPSADAVGYLLEGSESVYFAGDTELFPGMAALAGEIDLALLPIGGWGPTLRGGHLDPESAARALQLLRPRAALPIHWGTFWPSGLRRLWRARFEQPGADFLRRAAMTAPDVSVLLATPGYALRPPPPALGPPGAA